MNEETSRCITVLRFPLIVGVAYIHSSGFVSLSGTDRDPLMARLAVGFIASGFCRVSVPLLFLFSAYLLFRRRSFGLPFYRSTLVSRSKTLLVPYLFWNLFVLAVAALVYALPATRSYLEGAHRQILLHLGIHPIVGLREMFGFDGMPIAYQFWFVRDLIILVLLSPLAFYGAKYGRLLLVLVVGAAWLFNPTRTAWLPVSWEPLFFFFLGTYIALQGKPLTVSPRRAWLATFVASAIFAIESARVVPPDADYGLPLYHVGLLAACIAVLGLGTAVLRRPRAEKELAGLAGASFFVFAIHEPLLMILVKSLRKHFHFDATTEVGVYLLAPALIVAVTVWLYRILAKRMPRGLNLVTGAR